MRGCQNPSLGFRALHKVLSVPAAHFMDGETEAPLAQVPAAPRWQGEKGTMGV